MATLQTTEDFRQAIAHLQSVNHFGGAILQVNIGDTVAECEVLDDDTLTILTPDTATLEAALDSASAQLSVVANEVLQATTAQGNLKTLLAGLHTLTAQDKGYVVLARIMAKNDNQSNATIAAITTRAQATSYVTARTNWLAVPVAARPMLGDMLEAQAVSLSVIIAVLT